MPALNTSPIRLPIPFISFGYSIPLGSERYQLAKVQVLVSWPTSSVRPDAGTCWPYRDHIVAHLEGKVNEES